MLAGWLAGWLAPLADFLLPYPWCSKGTACPKNHIKHTQHRETGERFTTFHLEHHKTTGKLGARQYPLTKETVEVCELLEGASAFLSPSSRGFFFPLGQKKLREGIDKFGEEYFSLHLSSILSCQGQYVNATDIRKKFSTLFSDYLGQAQLSIEDVGAAVLRDATAALTGSSTIAWDRSYDIRAKERAYVRVLHHYPAFRAFVREDYDRMLAIVPRNPITGSIG